MFPLHFPKNLSLHFKIKISKNVYLHVSWFQHVSTRLRSPFWRFDLICIGGRGMAFGTTGGGTTTGRGGGTTTGRGLGLGDLGGDGGRISWCSACAAHPTVSHLDVPRFLSFSHFNISLYFTFNIFQSGFLPLRHSQSPGALQ